MRQRWRELGHWEGSETTAVVVGGWLSIQHFTSHLGHKTCGDARSDSRKRVYVGVRAAYCAPGNNTSCTRREALRLPAGRQDSFCWSISFCRTRRTRKLNAHADVRSSCACLPCRKRFVFSSIDQDTEKTPPAQANTQLNRNSACLLNRQEEKTSASGGFSAPLMYVPIDVNLT